MNDTLIRLNPHWSVGKYTDLHFRELLPELLKKLVLPHVHVLTGIRRSGKSSLFRLIVNHLMDSGVNPRDTSAQYGRATVYPCLEYSGRDIPCN